MEVFDQYSALLALGMPACLPKPRNADIDAPAGWHWSGLADLQTEVARRTLESFALDWFVREFGMVSLMPKSGGIELFSIRRKGSVPVSGSSAAYRKPLRKKLGELLLERGVIDEDRLEIALEIHRQTGRRLGETLLETNALTAEKLLPVLAEKLGVLAVTAEVMQQSSTPEAAFAIPEDVCRRHGVFCVIAGETRLHVAMADPTDVIVIDTLRAVTHKDVLPVLADPVAIADAIDRSFTVDQPLHLSAPVTKYVDATLREVLKQGATAVRFTPAKSEVVAEFLFDGLVGNATAPPLRIYPQVVARLKQLAGLDPAQSGASLQGRSEYTLEGDVVRLELEVAMGEFGETTQLGVTLVREAPSSEPIIYQSDLTPINVWGDSLLEAIILAVRQIRGDSDEGTGIHAKISV